MKHAMTTSMDHEETAENTLDLVKMLRAFAPPSSGPAVKTTGRSENKEKVRFLGFLGFFPYILLWRHSYAIKTQ